MRLFRDGLSRLAATPAEVREMDRRAIEEYGMPGAVLMENAGSEVAFEILGPRRRAVVFAGAGNNAGDGFVIARHLANGGVSVEAVTIVDAERYSGDAALNFAVMRKMALPVHAWTGREEVRLDPDTLIIDALLGTGLSGGLRPPFGDVISRINSSGLDVLAVDVPSGLDGDTGKVVTAAVKASATVTFALPKRGLFAGSGPQHAGEVILADIGMPRAVYPPGKVIEAP